MPEIMSEGKLAKNLEKMNTRAILEATTEEMSEAVYVFGGISE